MNESSLKKILVWMGVCLFIGFTLLPIIWMVVISFSENHTFLFTGSYGFTLSNYMSLLQDQSLHYMAYIKNSCIVSLITACIVSTLACCAGYSLSRLSFPGRRILPLLILTISMFPPISIVGQLYRLFSYFGLLNTYAALIFPYSALTLPLALWITMTYFNQIPKHIDNAALMDGTPRFRILVRLILPLSAPALISSFLLVFIACFNEFLFALMLTIDYHGQTIPVGIALFEGVHGEVPWGTIMASSVLASLPLIILSLLFQRYIVQGLTAGSVKG